MWVRIVALALVVSCQFRQPADLGRISCPDGQCPTGFVCRSRVGVCVARSEVPTGAPAVTNSQLTPSPARLKLGDTLSIQLTVSRPLLARPDVNVLQGNRRPAQLVSEQGLSYEYRYQVSTDDADGTARVVVDLIDTSGTEALDIVLGFIEFDSAPPIASRVGVRRERLVPCPVPWGEEAPLGVGSRLTVEALLNEEGRLALEAGTLTPQRVNTSQNFAAFSISVDEATASGTYPLTLRFTDTAGNEATRLLGSIVVDTQPPATPNIESADAILHIRRPWGTLDAATPVFAVTGSPGSSEPNGFVVVSTLGRDVAATAVTDAGFQVSLGTDDSLEVSIRAFDRACNSSPSAVVRNAETSATLAGKVVGRTLENPHRLTSQEAFTLLAKPGAGRERLLPAESMGPSGWAEINPPIAGRLGHAATFDRHRRRAVLFGGSSNNTFTNEVVEYDTLTRRWVQRTPSSLPSSWPAERRNTGLVYDEVERQALLFSGLPRRGVASTALYRYDLSSGEWTQVDPDTRNWPPARYGHAVGWDPMTRQMLVAAGLPIGLITPLTDLWAWSASTNEWSTLTSTTPVEGYSQTVAATFDTRRRTLVVFGNRNASPLSEYEVEGRQWLNRSPSGGPMARANASLAYDESRQRTVLFGGGTAARETWEWDGNRWWQFNPSPAPSARINSSLVYDNSRRVTLLLAGEDLNGTQLSDVWEWDGTRWLDVSPPTRITGTNHPPALGGASVGEAPDGGLYLFGGADADGVPFNKLWLLDSNFRFRTFAGSMPPPRYLHQAASSPGGDRLFVFGGFGNSGFLDDFWMWNGSVWSAVPTPTSRPSARVGGCMVTDPVGRRLLLFGGYAPLNNREENDLWQYPLDGGSWAQIQRPSGADWPSPRQGASCAYDPRHDVMMLFGGGVGDGVNDEGWEFARGGTWRKFVKQNQWPTARWYHAASYTPEGGEILIHGGIGPTGVFDDVWAWSGDGGFSSRTPIRRGPNSWPEPRESFVMAWLAGAQRTVIFGGGPDSTNNDRLWAFGFEEHVRPALTTQFDLTRLGVVGAQLRSAQLRLAVEAKSPSRMPSDVEVFVSRNDVLRPVAAASTDSTLDPTGLLSSPSGTVSVAVAPREANTATAPSSVRLNSIELILRTRR